MIGNHLYVWADKKCIQKSKKKKMKEMVNRYLEED